MKGKMMYTEAEIAEFNAWAKAHDMKFSTLAEYAGAIDQYFLEDEE